MNRSRFSLGVVNSRRFLLAVAACAALVVPVLAFADDSPPPTDCSGKVRLDPTDGNGVTYAAKCSRPIESFTLISTRSVDSFSTTADVTSHNLPVTGESFNCEGPIPGDGFRCIGKAGTNHRIFGSLTTEKKPCAAPRGGLRIWLVAVTPEGSSTEPFALAGPRCPRPRHRH